MFKLFLSDHSFCRRKFPLKTLYVSLSHFYVLPRFSFFFVVVRVFILKETWKREGINNTRDKLYIQEVNEISVTVAKFTIIQKYRKYIPTTNISSKYCVITFILNWWVTLCKKLLIIDFLVLKQSPNLVFMCFQIKYLFCFHLVERKNFLKIWGNTFL